MSLPTNPSAQQPGQEPAPPQGGQDFMPVGPSGAQTGGIMSQNAVTQTPINQDDTQVTPEEQKQYDDFVTRGLLFINDPRVPLGKTGHPQPNGKAPRDVIISHLNAVDGQAAEEAVGRTAAQVITIITNNAKSQGFPYPPDVIFHGANEILDALYKIGVASGVIKNMPPAGSPEEDKIMSASKVYAAQYFGQNIINSGQDTPEFQDQNKKYVLDQIQREGESGALDNWNPSQNVSPEKLTQFIHRAAIGKAQFPRPAGPPTTIADYAARGHPQLVQPGAPQAQPAPADATQADAAQAPPDQGGGQAMPQGAQMPPGGQ